MCRWAACTGELVCLEDIVSRRGHLLIHPTGDQAPLLYRRWSDTGGNLAVVPEPLEAGECWEEAPPGSFRTFAGDMVSIEPFGPERLACMA